MTYAMTNQEAFDTVLLGLREQGGPSTNGEFCRYRAPNGRKCAAGLLIRDEDYRPEIERWKATSYIVSPLLPVGVREAIFTHLQVAHDSSARGSNGIRPDNEWLALWEPHMAKIARDYGLTYTPPAQDKLT